ncbi:MAG TPA: hypothetical protein GX516_00470 [Thermoanaerobacter sp.]|nr:hypothetical protein [Thermoanaerobacter sp.]
MAEAKQINDTVSDLPEGFKMTELGPLPEEWEVVRLGDYCYVGSGGSAPQGEKYFNGGKYPFVRVQHIDNEMDVIKNYDLVTDEAIKDYNLKLFKKGTIIFPKSGASIYLEKRAILPFDAYIVSHLCAVNSKHENLDQKYLFFFLKFKKLADEKADGYPTLNLSEIKEVKIPLPPLSEQKAIAYVLQTVQRAKEAIEKVIQATQELKKSLMRHLFTYGPVPIDEVDKVQLKETEIGLVPEHWEVVRLGEVSLKPQYGFTASATNQPIGPKFLRITDIQNGRINWNTVPYCKIDDTLLRKYQLESGDLLFARIGATTGKSVLINECPEAVFASYLIRVRVNLNQLLPEFLFYFAQGNLYWSQIDAAKGGRLKQGINIPVLLSLHIPLPPLHEQQTIAHILQTVDQKIQAEKAKKQALEILFQSLLHHLTTGKLRLKDMVLSEAKEA